MIIKSFINTLHFSKCYALSLSEDKVVLIDPGDPDSSVLINWLKSTNKEIAAVLLTHEHADHCSGVIQLSKHQKFDLFCSHSCSLNIRNSKQNFSFYIDIIETFEVSMPVKQISDGQKISISGRRFTFIETPGHSPGSICIFTNNSVFTGDTILNGIKPPLTFMHSNRNQYNESIEKLKNHIKPGMTIYPGHGEPFIFTSFDDLVL